MKYKLKNSNNNTIFEVVEWVGYKDDIENNLWLKNLINQKRLITEDNVGYHYNHVVVRLYHYTEKGNLAMICPPSMIIYEPKNDILISDNMRPSDFLNLFEKVD